MPERRLRDEDERQQIVRLVTPEVSMLVTLSRSLPRAAAVALLLAAPFFSPGPTPAEVEHESSVNELAFDPLTLEPEIFSFLDREFVRIATEIQLGTASMQERRWWYRAAERYAPFENPPPAGWRLDAAIAGAALESTGGTIYNWSSIGPNGDYDVSRINGGLGARNQGRATAVWTHMDGPNVVNKQIIYLGFADGGVWKSVDGGDHWEPLIDDQPTLSVGALDVLPGQDLVRYTDATIYVGTGEGNFSFVDKDGVGVLKSTDGGATWTVQPLPFRGDELGIPGLHRIRRLRIDPSVPGGQSVWVAGDGGVYRTADGGATWSLVTGLPYSGAPANAAYPGGCWTEYATDFVIDPVDRPQGHSVLLAAYGRISDASCVTPAADARQNNGVYRSLDGGATWEKVSVSGQNGFPAIPGSVGRISLLSAPSNPKHVYALIANASTQQSLGIFDTLDATASPVQWTAGSTTNYTASQGWYDMIGAVDPTNENRLIVGGLDNYLSSDRGQTITKVSGWSAGDDTWAHADHHHAIWVDANTYYDANDGGLNIGLIDGDDVTWIDKNGDRLSTLQFYGLSQSATDPYLINAGLQDNGHALLADGVWQETYGGDGGFAATDQTDDSQAYEEYVYAAIRHSDDGGRTWPVDGCMQAFGACAGCLNLCVPDNHAAFITNFMLDTHNQDVMYVGTNYLYRNVDASSASKVWQRLTSDLLQGDFVKGAASSRAYVNIVHTPTANRVSGTPPMSQILYVGTSTGRIWRSDDAGLSWTDLTKDPLPVTSDTTGRYVTWIDTDPTDADRVVVSYSGWNASTSPARPGHIFRSNDGGATWTDISGALPDEPFNSLAVDPNPGKNGHVFVGSDTGVYLNTDAWNGDSWTRINNGLLPHVSVNMMQFTNATEPKRLRLATHGRGIWELFEQSEASLELDRAVYDCDDAAQVTLLSPDLGAGTKVATISSRAEPGGESLTLVEEPAGSGRFVAVIGLTGGAASSDGALSVLNADEIVVAAAGLGASAVTDCSTCGVSPSTAAGPNLSIDASSLTTLLEGGDGDEFLDNCETGRIRFSVTNTGTGGLTNLRVSRVSASNPGVRGPETPLPVVSSVAQCGAATVDLGLVAAELAPGEALDVTIELTADELETYGETRAITARFDPTEQDFVYTASRTFSFEEDLEGWTRVGGTFERVDGLGAIASLAYLASSSLTDGSCDQIRSPVVKLGANSTLSVWNQFEIEPITDAWYDRANVGVFDLATGSRDTVVPSGGRPYLAEGPNGVCATGGQPGWAGPGPAWLESSWTATDLDAAARSGRKVQIDVAYGTDPLVSLTGLQIDEVTLSDFEIQGPDGQEAVCPPPPPPCPDVDDADPAVEYVGGWHDKSDASATNGGYHRRTGSNKTGAAARIVFEADAVTYLYATAGAGGAADIYIDDSFVETLSYAGQGGVAFGAERTYSGLGGGSHELRIVHRSKAVYVDGFRFSCEGSGADAAAPAYGSSTETSTASASEGPVVTRSFTVDPADLEVSLVVEGLPQVARVEIVNSLGITVASGEALIPGLTLSGVDAGLAPGSYTVRLPNVLLPGQQAEISLARTTALGD
jgi:hypothetical protein